jgi:DNA replication protein DnaC
VADRLRRRIERHLAEVRLPAGKTLDSFEFGAVPMISKAQVMALTSGAEGRLFLAKNRRCQSIAGAEGRLFLAKNRRCQSIAGDG